MFTLAGAIDRLKSSALKMPSRSTLKVFHGKSAAIANLCFEFPTLPSRVGSGTAFGNKMDAAKVIALAIVRLPESEFSLSMYRTAGELGTAA